MSQERDAAEAAAPSATWPELRGWQPAGVNHPVFRAISTKGSSVYVRADDGSGPLLRRLEREPDVPAPRLLDQRAGWLLLEALPGVPLNDDCWLARPADAASSSTRRSAASLAAALLTAICACPTSSGTWKRVNCRASSIGRTAGGSTPRSTSPRRSGAANTTGTHRTFRLRFWSCSAGRDRIRLKSSV